MALNNKWRFGHFLVRLLGLLGLPAAIVGLVLWLSIGAVDSGYREIEAFSIGNLEFGPYLVNLIELGQVLAAVGAGLVLLALLVETSGLYGMAASRRGAVGFNVALQVALAVALLIGVNYVSFFHHRRYDWTREQVFTIDPKFSSRLAGLRGQTDIIVYQAHLSFGQSSAHKQDNYDAAAERKIVEKVKDLVEAFQELGPSFRVQVLDNQDEEFQDRLAKIRKDSPALADAIEAAPENSIFFHSRGGAAMPGRPPVQRLAFHDVYQLDREGSRQANDGEGNLVLSDQGVGPFARKILNIEEKQPRVAVGVIHPLLGTQRDNYDPYTLAAARKTLESQGFTTQDIILKKGFEIRRPEAAVLTYDESQFDHLDDQRAYLEKITDAYRSNLTTFKDILSKLQTYSLDKLNDEFIYVGVPNSQLMFRTKKEYAELKKTGRPLNTSHVDDKDRMVEQNYFENQVNLLEISLERLEPKLQRIRKDLSGLKIDELEEKRRIADLRDKMNRALADCDLLVVPRVTLLDIPDENYLPGRLHILHDLQYAAIRDFLRSGKPALLCLGPANEPAGEDGPGGPAADPLDKALEDLGFYLPRQTILFNSELDSFAQRRGNFLVSGSTNVEIPAVAFDWKQDLGLAGKATRTSPGEPHAVRSSMQFVTRSLGGHKELELKLRHPRPVYFRKTRWEPGQSASVVALLASPRALLGAVTLWKQYDAPRLVEGAAFMVSDAGAWNADQPFPDKGPPQFTPTKPTEPGFGTLDERRQGAFPLAAAAEIELPSSWFPERTQEVWLGSVTTLAASPGGFGPLLASSALVRRNEDKVSARVAVIGSGNVFTGKQLTPVQQKLLLDVSNWLLGREDLLAKNRETWQYPRVEFSQSSYLIWQWITRLGLPLLFVFLGLNVWLVRRMR